MATVFEYLESKKEANPELARYDYLTLYNKLKETDSSMPVWHDAENAKGRSKRGQTSYQRKVDPTFVNSLFDWTDWGIDENSSKWAQNAYNQSIAGMAYQMYNGEQRFDLGNYNPGIAEDIGSAVLSFMMPLDFLTMFVGGAVGKGLNLPILDIKFLGANLAHP